MIEKNHIPELFGGLSAEGSGSVVGPGLIPSPESAWIPPTSACPSPCAGSQHYPKEQDEDHKFGLLYDSSSSHKFKSSTAAIALSDDQMQAKQIQSQTYMKRKRLLE